MYARARECVRMRVRPSIEMTYLRVMANIGACVFLSMLSHSEPIPSLSVAIITVSNSPRRRHFIVYTIRTTRIASLVFL